MGRIADDNPYYSLRLTHGGVATPYGVDLPSVTSIIKAVRGSASGPMAWWGYNVAVDGVAAKLGKAPDTVKRWLREAKKTPNHVRDARGTEGTEAHNFLEALALGQVYVQAALDGEPYAARVEDDAVWQFSTGHSLAVAKWWLDTNVRSVLFAERPVLSLRGYTGTLDLAWYPDQELEICDLKTHKPSKETGGAYEEDKLQIGAYSIAVRESGLGVPRMGSVLLAQPDGSYVYEPFDLPEYEERFLAHLKLYQLEHGTGRFV